MNPSRFFCAVALFLALYQIIYTIVTGSWQHLLTLLVISVGGTLALVWLALWAERRSDNGQSSKSNLD